MKRTVTLAVAAAAVALWLAGCEQMSFGPFKPAEPQSPGRSAPEKDAPGDEADGDAQADYLAKSSVRGDDEGPDQGAVDVALEWSRKYTKAVDQLLQAQQANKKLKAENERLSVEITGLKAQLAQARTELAEANEVVLEQTKELRAWKKNVLGYREEMQRAQLEQMEAIKKILVLLGCDPARPAGQTAKKAASARAKDLDSDSATNTSG